jgi:DHA2 family lincomycin resistance protein-like MFS transporter
MMAIFTSIVNAGGGTEVPEAVAAGTRTSLTIGAIIATITIVGAFLIRKPEDDGEGAAPHAGH